METFDNPRNRLDYSYRGIFSVRCDLSRNMIFGESLNAYASLVEILWKLRTGSFENLELQKDFQMYSEDSFRFTPIRFGEEFADNDVRLREFQEILKEPFSQ